MRGEPLASPERNYKIWSSKYGDALGGFCSNLGTVYSQAAVQASKEGAKEVTLKHFEWAKVFVISMTLWANVTKTVIGSDNHGS